MFNQKISPHLNKLIKISPAVRKQYLKSEIKTDLESANLMVDPLNEKTNTKITGLIQKYPNRALILLTQRCPAYCQFCFRQNYFPKTKTDLTNKDLLAIKTYLMANPLIKEIIFSGGDPLMVPELLIKAIKLLSTLPQIKIIRIGTRIPVSQPSLINLKLLKFLATIKQPVYLLIHFEHPDELTTETIQAISKLKKAGGILLSQTVFLAGVNDSVEILSKLFNRLIEIGVKPYYLHRSDPIKGTAKFRVPIEKEIKIATELRKKLSGLAYPMYVIDAPGGIGKIPVPLNFWQFDALSYQDFYGKKMKII